MGVKRPPHFRFSVSTKSKCCGCCLLSPGIHADLRHKAGCYGGNAVLSEQLLLRCYTVTPFVQMFSILWFCSDLSKRMRPNSSALAKTEVYSQQFLAAEPAGTHAEANFESNLISINSSASAKSEGTSNFNAISEDKTLQVQLST